MNSKLALFFLTVLVITGCVPSLHPLYTEEDTVYEVSLVGHWGKDKDTWTFTENEDSPTYDLNIVMDGKDGKFTVSTIICGRIFSVPREIPAGIKND